MIGSIVSFDWTNDFELKQPEVLVKAYSDSIYYIGKTLVSTLVVPFIVSSFVLLAAVLGAISLVKEGDE